MSARDLPLPVLAPRPPDLHKGQAGRVLVIAGSPGYTGAACLAADAAMRGGAGLVTVACPARCWPILAARLVEPMAHPMPETADGVLGAAAEPAVLALARAHTVACVGPGLGRHAESVALVQAIVRGIEAPLVLDADGLNAVADDVTVLTRRRGPIVLTPHPGEMARLARTEPAAVQSDRERLARQFAAANGVIVVLKGHRTVVTDGRDAWVNPTGNPGMATAGAGDVLAGLLAALIGQGVPPFGAARLAVYLHGLAGDLARDTVGEVSLIASDLIRFLPDALRRHQGSARAAGPGGAGGAR